MPISVIHMGLPKRLWAAATYCLRPSRSFQDPYLRGFRSVRTFHKTIIWFRERNAPVETYEVHTSPFIVDLLEESGHPVEIPNDSRATQQCTLIRPRLNLLHVDLGGLVRIHVGLA